MAAIPKSSEGAIVESALRGTKQLETEAKAAKGKDKELLNMAAATRRQMEESGDRSAFKAMKEKRSVVDKAKSDPVIDQLKGADATGPLASVPYKDRAQNALHYCNQLIETGVFPTTKANGTALSTGEQEASLDYIISQISDIEAVKNRLGEYATDADRRTVLQQMLAKPEFAAKLKKLLEGKFDEANKLLEGGIDNAERELRAAQNKRDDANKAFEDTNIKMRAIEARFSGDKDNLVDPSKPFDPKSNPVDYDQARDKLKLDKAPQVALQKSLETEMAAIKAGKGRRGRTEAVVQGELDKVAANIQDYDLRLEAITRYETLAAEAKRQEIVARDASNEFDDKEKAYNRINKPQDLVKELEGAMGEGAVDFLEEQLAKAQEAQAAYLDKAIAEAKDEKQKQFYEGLKLGYYDIREDQGKFLGVEVGKWFGREKKIRALKLDKDAVNRDFTELLKSNPQEATKRFMEGMVDRNTGKKLYTKDEIDLLVKDKEFMQTAQQQYMEQIFALKMQTGKMTQGEAEIFQKMEGGTEALDAAVEMNAEAKRQLADLAGRGIIESASGRAFIKKYGLPALIGLLFAGLLPGLVAGGVAAVGAVASAAPEGVVAGGLAAGATAFGLKKAGET